KEFNFLVRQIDWRQERYEEKAISLNLQKRINKKILEQRYVEALDVEYRKFNEINYETVEFVTKISAAQEALSLKNQVTSDTTKKIHPSPETEVLEDKDTEDDDTPPFDIPLRESARIMADWITLSSK
ncbi:MAG: carboxy terminal-processing peptidase, partial [Verrucomicrobiota bacterium]|nr:carboxy terminal-processing peptidase [Verrucomicrobiota bacterium]